MVYISAHHSSLSVHMFTNLKSLFLLHPHQGETYFSDAFWHHELMISQPQTIIAFSCFFITIIGTLIHPSKKWQSSLIFSAKRKSHYYYSDSLCQIPLVLRRALLECVEVFRVAEVFAQKLVKIVWRCRYALASPELQALLPPAAPGHAQLQSAMGLCMPVSRSAAGRGRFVCRGAVLSNALLGNLRVIHHAQQFRTQIIPYTL